MNHFISRPTLRMCCGLAVVFASYAQQSLLAQFTGRFPEKDYANALERELIEASFDGKLDKVKDCLSKGARIDARYGSKSEYFKDEIGGWPVGGFNWTSLMAATEGDRFEVVEFLILRGANVRMHDGWGGTPLFSLSDKRTQRKEYDKLAALLLKNKADPNASTDVYIDGPGGETVLHEAVAWGHVEIVKMLIAAGAKVNAKTTDEDTPLDYVYEGRNDEAITKILTEAGGTKGSRPKSRR